MPRSEMAWKFVRSNRQPAQVGVVEDGMAQVGEAEVGALHRRPGGDQPVGRALHHDRTGEPRPRRVGLA